MILQEGISSVAHQRIDGGGDAKALMEERMIRQRKFWEQNIAPGKTFSTTDFVLGMFFCTCLFVENICPGRKTANCHMRQGSENNR